MASSTKSLELPTRFEDVLAYLPIARITEYGKGQIIYRPKDVSASIYLLMTGTVAISQIADNGSEVLLEIVRPEELFGESAFIDDPRRSEQATGHRKGQGDGMGCFLHGRTRPETAASCGGVAASSRAAQRRVHPPDRELFTRHHRTAARPFAHPLLRAAGDRGGRRSRTDDAIYSRAAITVRRYVARTCHPIYESVPETRLLDLFAARYPHLSRCSEGIYQLGRRIFGVR